MRKIFLFLILAMSIIILACQPHGTTVDGYTAVHFELWTGAARSVRATAEPTADAVIFVNVIADQPVIHHQDLVDGENVVLLEKDGLYLLGFVDFRSQSEGGIVPVGHVSLASVGASSIPLVIWSVLRDEYGVYHTAHVLWREIRDGRIYVPSKSTLEQTLEFAVLDFGEKGVDFPGTSVPIPMEADEVTVDLSPYELSEATHYLYPPGIKDIALNQYQFNMDNNASGSVNVIDQTTGTPVNVSELQGEWVNADYDDGPIGSVFHVTETTVQIFQESTDPDVVDPVAVATLYDDRDQDPADGMAFHKLVQPGLLGRPVAIAHMGFQVSGRQLTIWYSDVPGVQPDPDSVNPFTYELL